MIALERAGPICGSLSSSVAVAVFRLTLAAIGAVAAPVVAGAAAAGAGAAGLAGWVPCAKAGAQRSASVKELTRTRLVSICVDPSSDPAKLEFEVRLLNRAKRAFVLFSHRSLACPAGARRNPTDPDCHS